MFFSGKIYKVGCFFLPESRPLQFAKYCKGVTFVKMYSGKAKDVTLLGKGEVKITFRDSISAFDGVKKEGLTYTGELNATLLKVLRENDTKTQISD